MWGTLRAGCKINRCLFLKVPFPPGPCAGRRVLFHTVIINPCVLSNLVIFIRTVRPFFFDMEGSCYVSHADLRLTAATLPQPPKHWDSRDNPTNSGRTILL